MKPKILILHTSVGYGIKVTAEVILEKLQKSGLFEVRIEDIEKVENGLFSSMLKHGYTTILNRLSPLWGFLYNSNLVTAVSLLIRSPMAALKSEKILKLLREFQ